jgi:hypothetical protein
MGHPARIHHSSCNTKLFSLPYLCSDSQTNNPGAHLPVSFIVAAVSERQMRAAHRQLFPRRTTSHDKGSRAGSFILRGGASHWAKAASGPLSGHHLLGQQPANQETSGSRAAFTTLLSHVPRWSRLGRFAAARRHREILVLCDESCQKHCTNRRAYA